MNQEVIKLVSIPTFVSTLRILIKRYLKIPLSILGYLMNVFGKRSPGVRILFYHRINRFSFSELGPISREISVTPEMFEKQLIALRDMGVRTIDSEELMQTLEGRQVPDSKALMITFDDGYEDNLEWAQPLLEKYGFTALVFVISGYVGKETGQYWEYGDKSGLGKFLTWDQVKTLREKGIEIGAHTCTHPLLSLIKSEKVAEELELCKQELEGNLGEPIPIFAYPGGDFNSEIVTQVGRAGYKIGMTTIPGINRANTNPLLLNRTEVSKSDSLFLFKMKIKGHLDWLAIKESESVRRFMGRLTDIIILLTKGRSKANK